MSQITNKYVLVIFFFLLFIPISIYFFSVRSRQPADYNTSPTPSPAALVNQSSIAPTQQLSPFEAQENAQRKLQNRLPLSEADIAATKRILSLLPQNNQSGVLYESVQIIIDYTKGPDLFQVEILTTDMSKAKEEARSWFLSQGMSQEGICQYPVNFYLSWEVRQKMENAQEKANLLPPGC